MVLSSAYGVEILGRSGAFNVHAVAPERKALPLVNVNMAATSLDFVPHFSFAEYQASIGTPPDLIAVPWFPGYAAERDAPRASAPEPAPAIDAPTPHRANSHQAVSRTRSRPSRISSSPNSNSSA